MATIATNRKLKTKTVKVKYNERTEVRIRSHHQVKGRFKVWDTKESLVHLVEKQGKDF